MMNLLSIPEEEAACRKAWEPYATQWQSVHAWHLHHETLTELLTEPPQNRIDYILSDKPERERALRLRLFRPASAPTAPARKAYDEAIASADKAYYEAIAPARKAYYEAIASADKAYDEAIAPARKAYNEATAPARKAYDEAIAPARKAYNEATASAHAQECPECPWDGTTIFAGTKA